MTSPHPTARSGDAVVIFEGPKRIAWHERVPERWAPLGLWPDAGEAAEIRRHIAAGRPLLVVLDHGDPVVSLLREELAAAPPALAELADEPVGELITLRVPMLDWLPAGLRARGLRFLSRSTERRAATPAALRPALAFDDPDPVVPNVRFAHRLDPRVRLDGDLDAIVEHCFGTAARAGAGTRMRPGAAARANAAHIAGAFAARSRASAA